MSVIPYLPLEMMEQIFENVKDSQDFHNVTNSLQLWSDLMIDKKTSRLFDLVLPILLNEVNLSNDRRGLLPQLLTLRQVHPHWKAAVDRQFFLKPDHYIYGYYSLHPESSSERYENKGINDLLIYANSLPPGGNPFLGGYAKMRLSSIELADENFRQLVTNFGHHVKALKIIIRRTSTAEFGRNLAFFPNLERISVYRGDCIENKNYDVCHPDPTFFPRLPMLTTLKFCPALVTPKDLKLLSQVEWPLEHLSMINWGTPLLNEQYLGMLNNFSETLKTIKLNTVRLESNFDLTPLQVFPKLEEIELVVQTELHYSSGWHLEKLVSCCPSLKNLKITKIPRVEWGSSLFHLTSYLALNIVRQPNISQ
ncbi:unnamed protein product [Orchesella dallaii]|uniref:F-box domain-containing protein n=1 Tax=Orchesella dallaii TaxID=48710 RepID=A0ABP1S185_9HEXA